MLVVAEEEDVGNGTIAFCETVSQVEKLLVDSSVRAGIDILMAVTPDAAWELRRRGIDYQKPEDFYDEYELCSKSQDVADMEAEWACRVDDAAGSSVPEFGEFGFRPTQCHFHFLKILMDELYIRAFILSHILERCRPAKVVYYGRGRHSETCTDLFFRESVYSLIMPMLCQSRGIAAEMLDLPPGEHPVVSSGRNERTGPSGIATRLAGRLVPARELDWLRLFAQHGARDLIPALIRTRRGKVRIVLQPTYDVGPLWYAAGRAGFRCDFWFDLVNKVRTTSSQMTVGDLRDRLSRLRIQLHREEFYRKPFRCSHMDLHAAAEPSLQLWWNEIIPESWRAFLAARHHLTSSQPQAIVVPQALGHIEVAIMQAARSLSIPTVIYQHGGFGGTCQYLMWELNDLQNADYMFFYGQTTASYYSGRLRRTGRPHAEPVVTGSARLDDVRTRARRGGASSVPRTPFCEEGKPTILYVPGQLMGYTRYLCCEDYPDVSYFELQYELCRVFASFPDILFVYKDLAGRTHNPVPDLARLTCPNCRVTQDIPLTELIWAADGIIVDFPATALLESLLTSAKIIAYADRRSLRMTDEAKEMLRRRATLAETPQDFLAAIRSFLEAGDFSKERSPNADFLRAYGTYHDDGKSVERCLATVTKILRDPRYSRTNGLPGHPGAPSCC